MRLFARVRPTGPKPLPPQTGGAEARKSAEAALEEGRARHAEMSALRTWLRRDYERNHYADTIEALFLGRPHS